MAKRGKKLVSRRRSIASGYQAILGEISSLLESARRASARTVNAILTTTYWEVGRRIVEFEQQGEQRAEYGKELLQRLSKDLSLRFGRGFSERNLRQMRTFYGLWPIWQTLSAKSISNSTVSYIDSEDSIQKTPQFLLPWSHYVQLLSVKSPEARHFYEQEAIRGGWSIRQLSRQIDSQFALKGSSMARYTLEGLPNKVMAAEYRTLLPDEKTLVREIDQARKLLAIRKKIKQ